MTAVAGLLTEIGLGGFLFFHRSSSANMGAVRRDLAKQKKWLRRNEYNAAMVKGRQNLELLLKTVAENKGIRLENSAAVPASAAAAAPEKQKRKGKNRKKDRVMTNQEFCHWLSTHGYLDRVAKWELNEIRIIGNKAVHENFDSREEAWNQYDYLEDITEILEKAPEKEENAKTSGERKNWK